MEGWLPALTEVRGVVAIVDYRPRHERLQGEDIHAVEVQVFDLPRSHHVGNRGVLGFDLGDVPAHGDELRHRTDRELQVDAEGLANRQGDAAVHELLKTRDLHCHHVVADRNSRCCVFTGRATDQIASETSLRIGDYDFGIGNNGARGVCYRPHDACRVLRPNNRAEQKEKP